MSHQRRRMKLLLRRKDRLRPPRKPSRVTLKREFKKRSMQPSGRLASTSEQVIKSQLATQIEATVGSNVVAVLGAQLYNYGPYGIGLWSERSKCMPPATGATLTDGSLMVGFQLDDEGESGREIEALVRNARLLHPIEQYKLDRLSTVHNGFRRTQNELVSLLQQGRIAPDEYLERYNSALRAAMRENESVLGHQDFISVFGEAGLVPEGLIDRDTFFSERKNDPPRLRTR